MFGHAQAPYPPRWLRAAEPSSGYQCQRKKSTSQKVGIDIALPNDAPTPKFALGKRNSALLGSEAIISGAKGVQSNDFFIEKGNKLHFSYNLISVNFSPSKIGKRVAVLRTNVTIKETSMTNPNGTYTIKGKLPTAILLIGYGICPGHDSDGDLLTDDFENQFLGTDIYNRDSDNDGLLEQNMGTFLI